MTISLIKRSVKGSQLTASEFDANMTAIENEVNPTIVTADIADDAVDNTKLANMAAGTYKMRVTASTGSPEDATATQATAGLNVVTTALKGLAPASGGGTTNFLRADATWAAPAGGGGGLTDGDKGDITVGGTGTTLTIDNDAVTLAKLANAAASSKLLGSGASGAGTDYVELTLGTNLAMSGTTLNATGGGGSSDSEGITYLAPYTGSVSRNAEVKLAERVSVKDFGATGDGTTNDTAAIQAALDWTKSASATYPMVGSPRDLYFPVGTYIINAPLNVCTGNRLIGEGQRSLLKTGGSFSGTKLLNATFASNYCSNVLIKDLGFEVADSVNAIEISGTGNSALNWLIEDCLFKCFWGIINSAYAQGCIIRHLTFTGANKTLIRWQGNANVIDGVHRESGDGTAISNTTDPLIDLRAHNPGVERSYELRLDNIILEGFSAANKPGLVATGYDLVRLSSYHHESAGNGYCLQLTDCRGWHVAPMALGTLAQSKIQLTNSHCDFEFLDTMGEEGRIQAYVIPDANSIANIKWLRAYRTQAIPISPNLRVRNQEFQSPDLPQIARSFESNGLIAGYNYLQNPSFEGGEFGWGFFGTGTRTYITSEVGPGLMFKVVPTTNFDLQQQFTFPADWVGSWWTFSCRAKCVNTGGVTGFNRCWANITQAGTDNDPLYSASEMVAAAGEGWVHMQVSFKPTAGTTFYVGGAGGGPDVATGNTQYFFDDMCLSPGLNAPCSVVNQQQIELGGRSIASGTAIPTTGTWKRGDLVLNNTTSGNVAPGWSCITAGSPGTWRPMAAVQSGITADLGDAGATYTLAHPSAQVQRAGTTFTANRTVTLPTLTATDFGVRYTFLRDAATPGNFTWTIGSAATLPANTQAEATIEWDINTSTWRKLEEFGSRSYITASGTSFTPNCSTANTFNITASGGALTIAAPTNAVIGERYTFFITQDGTGGRAVSWNAVFKFHTAWADTGNTANLVVGVEFICISSTVFRQITPKTTYIA